MKRLAITLLALVLLATLVLVFGSALVFRGHLAEAEGPSSVASDAPVRFADEPLQVAGEPLGVSDERLQVSDQPSQPSAVAPPLPDQPLRLADEPPQRSGERLHLSDEPPLRLGEEKSSSELTAKAADNSRCHVCHLNFAMEELATVHAEEGIGCIDCHGDCDAHIADESWASGGPGTPPGIMFPLEQIDPACQKCHHSHNVPAAEVIGRWQARCPEKTRPEEIVCTDCHGRHRLQSERRKAWWDKRTGKPIAPPHEKRDTAQ